MPRWSSEQIAQYQSEDSDLKKLYSAKQEGDERPHWNTYSGESPACKAYFAEWKRIELWGKVLYRRWESNDGKTQRMQLVVPKALQRMICREVHDGRNTCHMGKKRALKLLMKNFSGTNSTVTSRGGSGLARSVKGECVRRTQQKHRSRSTKLAIQENVWPWT